jgi:regulatory protein SWI5
MISTATAGIQKRHRQHRRQNSTPMALEAAKAPTIPVATLYGHHLHRRGQSVDQRARLKQPSTRWDGTRNPVSETTAYHQSEKILREVQQLRLIPPDQSSATISLSQSQSRSSSFEYQQLNQYGMEKFANATSNENTKTDFAMVKDIPGFEIQKQDPDLSKDPQSCNQPAIPEDTLLRAGNCLSPSYTENLIWDLGIADAGIAPPEISQRSPNQPVNPNPSTPTKQVNSGK